MTTEKARHPEGQRAGHRPELRVIAGVLGALAIMLVVVRPVIGAPLGPVDDHEILDITAGRLGFEQAVIEIGRFRPAYWVFRFSETALWETNPTGWLLDRVVLGVVTLVLGYALARRFASPPLAALAAVAVVVGPQAEAWFRFGPQEAYATPLLLGAVLALARGRVALALGLAVLLALTKESFWPAAVVIVWLGWRAGERRDAIRAAVPILGTGLIITGLALVSPTLATLQVDGQGRYLLPALLIPIGAMLWLGRRHRSLATASLACWIGLGLAITSVNASAWAAMNRQWGDDLVAVRAAMRPGLPLFVHASTAEYELAFSFRSWVPDGEASLNPTSGTGYLWRRLVELETDGGFGYRPMSPGRHLDVQLAGLRVLVTPS